jgi:hypothetical protein
MGFFGKRGQQERDNVQNEERYDIENAIAEISARLRFLEALTCELVVELTPTKRDRLLQQLEEVVAGLKVLPPHMHVPPGREHEFHKVLSSALQVLVEKMKNLKPSRRASFSESGNDGCAGGPNHGSVYSPLPGISPSHPDPVRTIAEAKEVKRGKRG